MGLGLNNKLVKSLGVLMGNICYSGLQAGNRVAITFDDGPSPYTELILGILAANGVKASFFVTGEQVIQFPEIVQKAYGAGNDIGIHMWSHSRSKDLGLRQRRQEIIKSENLLTGLGIREVKFVRPPWGQYNWTYWLTSVQLGKQGILWSVDCRDWTQSEPEVIVDRAVEAVKGGSIILLHDGGGDRTNTVRALPEILTGLLSRGLQPVTLSSLLAINK